MEQFSEEYFMQFIRQELAKQYYRYPAVQGMFELDDLVMDVVLWYYQPTRKGIVRLNYYMQQCNYNLNHFYNHLKYGLRQYVPALLRYNFMQNIPTSLNVPLDNESESTEFIDMLADEKEAVDSQISFNDTLDNIKALLESQLKKSLTMKLYKEAKESNPSISYNEFCIYPTTIVKVWPIVRNQMNIIKDLSDGYKASELREKYENYDNLIKILKSTIETYYQQYGETVSDLLGRRKLA